MSKETSSVIKPDRKSKDPAVFIIWISALLILAGVFWVLTQPVRTRALARAVNRVLEQSEDFRRLEEHSYGGSGFLGMNTWFTMTGQGIQEAGDTREVLYFQDGTKAVVFPFIGEGTFFPCLAVLSPEGKVIEFIPLNNYGKRIISRISPGIIKIYARRIEGNAL
jgi:hypothetical protein